MSLYLHTDVLDNGLSELAGGTLTAVVCQGAPSDRTAAATLASSGGNRVSDALAVTVSALEPGANANSRQVRSPQVDGVAQQAVSGGDLWVALYDATRLLVVTDDISDADFADGATLRIPEVVIGFSQPVLA